MNENGTVALRDELVRVRRVADMLASAHSHLRDRYQRRAVALDLCVLGLSTWVTAIVFIEPQISVKLTPFGVDPRLWIGFLGIFTFFLSIVQLRIDWKGCADAHKRAFDMYAEVKRECGYLLASDQIDNGKCQRVLARYDMATDVGVAVPERDFLREKQRHLRKVAISRYLDTHPGAWLIAVMIRLWWRDTVKSAGIEQIR